MIVVAIIGILAAVAIPQYQNYVARAQVAEGLSMASSIKTAISEYYSTHGKYPSNNTALGIDSAFDIKGSYVNAIKVRPDGSGSLEILFKDVPDAHSAIKKRSFYMIPTDEGGSISWQCHCKSDPTKHDCENGTRPILKKYLPSSCLKESAADPGPVAWTPADGDACWDPSFDGWVAGKTGNTSTGNQIQINQYAELGYGSGVYSAVAVDELRWYCE